MGGDTAPRQKTGKEKVGAGCSDRLSFLGLRHLLAAAIEW